MVVDECQMVLYHFMNTTMNSIRHAVFILLRQIIRKTKKVVFMQPGLKTATDGSLVADAWRARHGSVRVVMSLSI